MRYTISSRERRLSLLATEFKWLTPTRRFITTLFSQPRIANPGLPPNIEGTGLEVRRRHRTQTRDDRFADRRRRGPSSALVTAPPTLAPSQIAQILKGESSKWIHGEFHQLRGFSWQDGYGAFSVSTSSVPQVISYIQNQREHHRRKTFQEEYLEFLQASGIKYDERYLWG